MDAQCIYTQRVDVAQWTDSRSMCWVFPYKMTFRYIKASVKVGFPESLSVVKQHDGFVTLGMLADFLLGESGRIFRYVWPKEQPCRQLLDFRLFA